MLVNIPVETTVESFYIHMNVSETDGFFYERIDGCCVKL